MRPLLHFTAERGWINDPHGITFRDGRYHQFHQFVPDSLVWQPNCHWGHAVGDDLFSLEHRPVALAPGDGDDGIWTGSLVVDDAGAARIFYTSVVQPGIGIGRVRVATPADAEWNDWIKGEVLITAPEELEVIAYRDPFVFRDGAAWRMYVGAGLRDGTATALQYRSDDLAAWEFEGIGAQRSTRETEPVWMGALWECPQQFEVDGTHALVSSVWDDDVLYYAGYGVGDYADGRFAASDWGRLTYGPSYYAPSFFRDAEGRPCLVFWMRGVQDAPAGWASAHSIPYVVGRDGDRLVLSPHPDLDRRLAALGDADGLASVADVVWDPGAVGELVLADDDGTIATIRATRDAVSVDSPELAASCPRLAEEPLRVLVDGPVLEIVVDGALLGGAVRPASALRVRASGEIRVRALDPLG